MRAWVRAVLLTLSPLVAHAATPEIYIIPWVGVQPERMGILCPDVGDVGGNADARDPADSHHRLSWGGDVVLGVARPVVLWVSAARRVEPHPCDAGQGTMGWVIGGASLSTDRTAPVSGEFGLGGGPAWLADQAAAWLVEGRVSSHVRVSGPLAVELSAGLHHEEGLRLSISDFFARGGIRFGPLWGAG